MIFGNQQTNVYEKLKEREIYEQYDIPNTANSNQVPQVIVRA